MPSSLHSSAHFRPHVARSLMRATRALLADRLGRVRREGLTRKDLDNQAYLFRAALSKLRAEQTATSRSEITSMRERVSTIRREVDRLDVKMKEDLGNLKHEITNGARTLARTRARQNLKQRSMAIEEVLNKSIVQLGDLRAKMEEGQMGQHPQCSCRTQWFRPSHRHSVWSYTSSGNLPTPPPPPSSSSSSPFLPHAWERGDCSFHSTMPDHARGHVLSTAIHSLSRITYLSRTTRAYLIITKDTLRQRRIRLLHIQL
ncbi:hypothetical protein EDD16DRAFT_941943 [Pisolithus croceorrhizus]|nr:hypothetical protein EDD16DRAFT_941943 [Pisolithus croceorrhizus]